MSSRTKKILEMAKSINSQPENVAKSVDGVVKAKSQWINESLKSSNYNIEGEHVIREKEAVISCNDTEESDGNIMTGSDSFDIQNMEVLFYDEVCMVQNIPKPVTDMTSIERDFLSTGECTITWTDCSTVPNVNNNTDMRSTESALLPTEKTVPEERFLNSRYNPGISTNNSHNFLNDFGSENCNKVELLPSKPCGKLDIEYVDASSSKVKKGFCILCKKLFSQFSRHLTSVHKDNEQVKKIIRLSVGSKERRSQIEIFRKQGAFEHNTNAHFNKNKKLLVCRRPTKSKTPGDFECCYNCKGFFSKFSLRKHAKKCTNNNAPCTNKGDRSLIILGRKTRVSVHEMADDTLRNVVIPILRDDDVTDIIKHDKLLIKYGNMLCKKFKSPHHHKMIRSRLRILGRFLINVENLDHSITSMTDIYDPKKYDTVIKAINNLATLSRDETRYRAPSVAANMGTLLKKIGNVLIAECIKMEDHTQKQKTENFLHLLCVDYSSSIARTALETQKENHRLKKVSLPSSDDIKRLNIFLAEKRRFAFNKLRENFNFIHWKHLASYVLSSVQIFNRRRAGEIERIFISDYKSFVSVDEETDQEIFSLLSPEGKRAVKTYVRFQIRGKLGRSVPVLLHKEIVMYIEMILEFRNKAGVSLGNPYLFGIPGGDNKHLSACQLLRKYSVDCGAKNPTLLTGTNLRKHIATQSVLLDLKETEVNDLAQFMGHHEKVHRDYYRLPVVTREISNISKLLEKAQCINVEPDFTHNGDDVGCTSDGSFISRKSSENLANNSDISPIMNKRSVSPLGHVSRRSWTDEEREAVSNLFNKNIKSKALPRLSDCLEAVSNCEHLKNRSPQQLKTYIHNQIKKEMKNQSTLREHKEGCRKLTWSVEENRMVKDAFKCHFECKKIPSLQECQEVIDKNPLFKKRTAITLRAKVNNELRKLL